MATFEKMLDNSYLSATRSHASALISGSGWKVKNFSGNLEEMTAPSEKREEFEPEVYYFF